MEYQFGFRVKIEKLIPKQGDRYESWEDIYVQKVAFIDIKGIADLVNRVNEAGNIAAQNKAEEAREGS